MDLLQQLAAGYDHFVVTASREDVEAGDIGPPLSILRQMLAPEVAKRVRFRVDLSVSGYDDDPRELYEIPEVRRWLRTLDREFPYWFYFLHAGRRSALGFIAMSLCEAEKVQGRVSVATAALSQFLTNHFAAMNEIANRLGDSPHELQDQSLAIGAKFRST